MRGAICATVVLAALTTGARAEVPYQVAWKSQIGSSEQDCSYSTAVDAWGNVYISGYTRDDLGGINAGNEDVFASKFDSEGNEIWTTQIGAAGADRSYSIAVDASGNAYIGGRTEGGLGGPNAGYSDAFLSKLDPSGNEVWTTQFGTNDYDSATGVAVGPSGNAYISGYTLGDLDGPSAGQYDAFLGKFGPDGANIWMTQTGTTSSDLSQSVAVDAIGNVYISGQTRGDLGGSNAGFDDVFVSKFDSDGEEIWTSQIGSDEFDYSYSVAVDASGSVYVAGRTFGDLGGPVSSDNTPDLFLSKFDSDGNELWTNQMGSGSGDSANSVAVDLLGEVYITGRTDGDLGGPNAGSGDAILGKFDSDGNLIWMTQLGTDAADTSHSIAIDASGNVYISGETLGTLGESRVGSYDAFLVKYDVPEPATLSFLALGGLAVLRRRRAG
jgi:hypothetical protein